MNRRTESKPTAGRGGQTAWSRRMEWTGRILAAWLLVAVPSVRAAVALGQQAAAPALHIEIVEGEGAVNNIRERTAREPIVRVVDENNRPVAGVAVVFLLPQTGAGGAFAGGAKTLNVITNQQGMAAARGLQLNSIAGDFQIRVTASFQGQTASASISQTNAAGAAAGSAGSGGAAAGAGGGGLSTGAIVGIVAAVAGAAVGIALGVGGGGNGGPSPTPTPTPTPTIGVSVGTPTVGTPTP